MHVFLLYRLCTLIHLYGYAHVNHKKVLIILVCIRCQNHLLWMFSEIHIAMFTEKFIVTICVSTTVVEILLMHMVYFWTALRM